MGGGVAAAPRFLSVSLGCLLTASLVVAGPAPGDIDRSEYRSRRLALAESLRKDLPDGGTGVLILHAAPESELTTYRQESNLYYLTGTEIPRSTLVLLFNRPQRGKKRADEAKGASKEGSSSYAEYLYLAERDYRQERWTGAKPGAGGLVEDTLQPDSERKAAMEATGFDRIPEGDYPPRRYPKGPIERSADLAAHLNLFLANASILFHLAEPGPLGEALSPDLAFLKEIRERFPWLPVKSPGGALGRLRMIKSRAELERLRRAIEITCRAQRDAMKQARPGIAEYEIEGIIEGRFISEGARRPGYASIVGSGPNSCVLHYDANERTSRDADLILIDVGAEYRRYSADVTRTIPANGHFTAEQRRIYDVVLKAQKEAIAAIRPGVPFGEIHKTARKVIEEAGYGAYFIHGTSHYLGLDVHDSGDTSAMLEPGMVLTVEPGIYLRDKELGIRIEDDVLVTRDGAQILSACVPREAEAVERQMAEASSSGTTPSDR